MTISVQQQDDITIITIQRPEAKNAVNRPTAEALAKAFREFDNNENANVAILTGEGTFCAGAGRFAQGIGRHGQFKEDS